MLTFLNPAYYVDKAWDTNPEPFAKSLAIVSFYVTVAYLMMLTYAVAIILAVVMAVMAVV